MKEILKEEERAVQGHTRQPGRMLRRCTAAASGRAPPLPIVKEAKASGAARLILPTMPTARGHLLRHIEPRVLCLIILIVRGGYRINLRIEAAPHMIMPQQLLLLLAAMYPRHHSQ